MATVTKDTLSDSSITFLRDVLRENLTDTQSPARAGTEWIFKSRPEDRDFDAPFVVIDESSASADTHSQGRKVGPDTVRFNTLVWADGIKNRDSVKDEIVKVWKDRTNTDGSNSIASQGLVLKSYSSSTEDGVDIDGSEKLVRIKSLVTEWKYTGA